MKKNVTLPRYCDFWSGDSEMFSLEVEVEVHSGRFLRGLKPNPSLMKTNKSPVWSVVQWWIVTGCFCKGYTNKTLSTFQHHPALSDAMKHIHSVLSHFADVFYAHWVACLNAKGQRADIGFPGIRCPSWWAVPAPRYSIQTPCHSCQWQDTELWIPKRCRILTVAAAIHRQGEAYLQRAAS